jgi:molybdopterin/thiamine biosynthesis adenylyltransferase
MLYYEINLKRAEACVESLQTLNPLVKIVSDSQPVEDKDEAFFNKQNFDLVCALTNDLTVLKRVNALCRQNNVLFLCSYVHGLYGYMFVDFNKYQFIA